MRCFIKHIKIILLLIFVIIYNPLDAYAVYFRNIGVKDGLSQVSVMSVHQDALGRMWFGTLEGISIYDGINLTTIKGGDKDFEAFGKKNQIFAITENANNDIFLLANDALIEYRLKQGTFHCLRQSGVSSVASIRGEIYVATNDSILCWNEQEAKLQLLMKTSLKGTINRIFSDSKNTLWIGTSKGLYKKSDEQFICVIPDKNIYGIFESKANELWIGTRTEGMYLIDNSGNISEFLHNPNDPSSISSNLVRTFTEDQAGNIWIGTFSGLNKFSQKDKRFTLYTQDDEQGSLSNSSVYSLFRDNQGIVWIGTYYGGVDFFNPDQDFLTYYPASPNRKDCLNFPFIGHIIEDRRNDLWICTEGGGLNLMKRNQHYFENFSSNKSAINHINLKNICYDETEDRLYIGSHRGGLIRYDIKNNRFKNYLDEGGEMNKLPHKVIINVSIFGDELIFLSESGLFRMDTKSEKVKRILEVNECSNFLIDSKDNIWILRLRNIIRVNMHDTTNVKVFENEALGLGRFNASYAYESDQGGIYFGTLGNGVLEYDYNTDKFSTYTSSQNGLLSDYCYSIAKSKKGYLVILGDKGLSFFDSSDKKVKYVISRDQLPTLAFNEGNGVFVSDDGTIFVGSTNGLIQISESELNTVPYASSFFFSSLFVNNNKVVPNDETGILKQIICFTEEISLDYRQNNVVLAFSDNNYGNITSRIVYEYKLEGVDEKWIPVRIPQLTYTNLTPGKYTLKVRRKDMYENAEPKEIRLNIVIKEPFYNTGWAWLVYVLLAVGSLSVLVSVKTRQMRLKQSLDQERREKENIEELNRFKVTFFTNVSHELRTPLTLIFTQIEMLLNNNDLSKPSYDKIKSLHKNAAHMLNLISELLDFHKAEQQHLRLKVCKQNLVPFLENIYESFSGMANALRIEYSFSSSSPDILCYYDPKQLQKVFFNLVSNAFKYIDKGKYINITLTEEDESIVVRVIDNGSGISKEDINNLFKRFYQASSSSQFDKTGSTGIGLALSKNIIELHRGEISVESKSGYGSIFIVKLKKGKEHFENNPLVVITQEENTPTQLDIVSDVDVTDLLSDTVYEELNNSPKGDYSILIVEDNTELLSMLVDVFSPLYNVLTATNGEEGFYKALEEKPNIILSDVMMPYMSGIEMCHKLKNNINTSHIPIILLTARTTSGQQIEGLLKGADGYVTKPFDVKLILVKINTILRSREMLRASFQRSLDFHPELLGNNELDQNFLKKVEEVIKTHIENPGLDVEKLAYEVAMGRSSFFEKLKKLTGMTPANFILAYRLRYAASLLKTHPELQVNDIAYKLGFSSGRYFSRCFKAHFNISPVKYRQQT